VGSFPRRGEIYWVNFDPARGSEQAGKRPAVVVTNDTLNQHSSVVTVAPITSAVPRKSYPHVVLLPVNTVLGREGAILCNQLRTIAKDRLEGHIGNLAEAHLAELERAIVVALGLPR
jgi:mRNA interferase MazF